MPVNYLTPSAPVVPVRDPNFTTKDEAMAVANNLALAPELKDATINVQAVSPVAPNLYPQDGRLWHQISFGMQMDLPFPETGRNALQPVEFALNAGLLLDFVTYQPSAPWKFNASQEARAVGGEMYWMGAAKK